MSSGTMLCIARLLRTTTHRLALVETRVATNCLLLQNRNYSCLIQTPATNLHKHQPLQNLTSKRFKKKGKKADREEEEESDDEDDLAGENPLLVDDILGGPKTDEQLTLDIQSLRIDALIKSGFAISRAKVEELFYQGHIYVNGQRPSKKSNGFSEGDEIDIFKGLDEENHNIWNVKRLTVTKVPDKLDNHGRAKIVVERSREMKIEPHTNDTTNN